MRLPRRVVSLVGWWYTSRYAPLETRMWYVYVLQSRKTDRWYTGSTRDLRKRISRHNSGQNSSTKSGMPWKVIYCEIGLD